MAKSFRRKRHVIPVDLRPNDSLMLDRLAELLNIPKAVVMRMALKKLHDEYFDIAGNQLAKKE